MTSGPHPALSPEQEHALGVLSGASRILLTGHERPDGDCIGAQAALTRVLESLGKEVTILNPDPPEVRFAQLTRAVAYGVDDGGAIPQHDLLVLLDGSELSRTGRLAERFEAAPSRKLVIDHHILPPDRWWDACFHDVTASATGVLVARIAAALGVELDEVAAQGVFTSIVTDTGWFKYSNTDAETLVVAGNLVQRGVDIAGQFMDLNQRRPEAHPVELGRLLARTEYFAGGRVALLTLPLGTDGQVPEMDTDDALDVVRSVDGVEVVLFVREIHPGLCKLSARSKTTFDVAALARTFGGGGHRKASGATLEGELADAARRVVQLAVQQLGS